VDQLELAFAGIARQAELLQAREVSSLELVELYLERIERIDPKLNAFALLLADEARAAARGADERLGRGEEAPLLGVPIALKDELDDVEGLITANGTSAFDQPAVADAEHTRRLRQAGAVLLGKTTLPELAIFGFTETKTYGETRNPWNPERTPGGSSGGSAAAVAAGLVGAASGSDGAGSIRIPAANCGLFGLKPQRGRISLAPLREHWLGMTMAGCLSRRVRDTALWLDVAAGPVSGDADSPPPRDSSYMAAATRDPGRLRVAWSLSSPRALAPPLRDPEVEAAVEGLAELFGQLGHQVEQRDPSWGLIGSDCANRYLKAIEAEIERVPHPERLERRTRGFGRLAKAIPAPLLRRSLAAEARHASRINRIFEDFDVLLLPATATPPVEVGRWEGRGALRTLLGMSRVYPHTIAWNYLGNPAASIPAPRTADGLPVAVQLVAAPNREDLLLSLGAQLEAELRWPDERPPLTA
jgi:amidase